jgi:homoserine dehydrogenase
MNAVLVEGDAVGPTLYYGAGAGAEPTASAVVADLVDLARDLSVGQSCRIPALGFARDSLRDLPIVPMEKVETAWYLRMEAQDKPGVMSHVTRIFSEQGISIEGLIQKAPAPGETCVPIIVLTNKAAQGSVDKAVRAIEALDTINGEISRIRVETLDG